MRDYFYIVAILLPILPECSTALGEGGFQPQYRPTIEKAVEDAEWIAKFQYHGERLMDPLVLKGSLPNKWIGDRSDQLSIHADLPRWLDIINPTNTDLFVFFRSSTPERRSQRSWIVVGDVPPRRLLKVHNEFVIVCVDIQGRYTLDSRSIEKRIKHHVHLPLLESEAQTFCVVPRWLCFDLKPPHEVISLIPTIPNIPLDWDDQRSVLPKNYGVERTPPGWMYSFYAEHRFIDPLLRKLNEGDLWERADAARCLRNYTDARVVAALRTALSDTSVAPTKGKVNGQPDGGNWYPVRQEAYNSLCKHNEPFPTPTGVMSVDECLDGPDRNGFVTLDVQELEQRWGLEPFEIPGCKPVRGIELRPVLPSKTLKAQESEPTPITAANQPFQTTFNRGFLLFIFLTSVIASSLGFIAGRRKNRAG